MARARLPDGVAREDALAATGYAFARAALEAVATGTLARRRVAVPHVGALGVGLQLGVVGHGLGEPRRAARAVLQRAVSPVIWRDAVARTICRVQVTSSVAQRVG